MSPTINKFLVAGLTAIATLSAVLAFTPDVAPTTPEWFSVLFAFFGALGVYAIPNTSR